MCKKNRNVEQAVGGRSLIMNPLCNTVAPESVARLWTDSCHWLCTLTLYQVLGYFQKKRKEKKISWVKYHFRQKTRNSYIFVSHCVFLFVLFVSVPIKESERRSVTNKRARPHPVCTHAMRWREESAVYKQTELKGLTNGSYSLFNNWKHCGPAADPCRYDSAFCRRAESLPLGFNLPETCAHTQRHTDWLTDRVGEPQQLTALLLPGKPCLVN